MTTSTRELLIQAALEARAASHCPYSHFAVGAALLLADGTVYTGANIEVSSYSPTVCAERVAFFRAIHEGRRDFCAIAIVGGGEGKELDFACPPCGVCRQVMAEFCGDDFKVILFDGKEPHIYTLGEILPLRFGL